MRKTVSAGSTSAKIQMNHLLAITAYGKPELESYFLEVNEDNKESA